MNTSTRWFRSAQRRIDPDPALGHEQEMRVYCHRDDQIKFIGDDGRASVIHPLCEGGPAGLRQLPNDSFVPCPKCNGAQFFYVPTASAVVPSPALPPDYYDVSSLHARISELEESNLALSNEKLDLQERLDCAKLLHGVFVVVIIGMLYFWLR